MANRQVEKVNKSAEIEIDLEGVTEKHQFVVAGLEFDLVLGLPWLEKNKAVITAKDDSVFTVSWNGRTISKDLRLLISFISAKDMRKMHRDGAVIFTVYCQQMDDSGCGDWASPTLADHKNNKV